MEKIKKYDVFIFYNELDLLEIRMEILFPYVDYFLIVESTKTFTGKSKPLYFKENQSRFKKFKDKIKHYVVEETPDTFEEVSKRIEIETDDLERRILEDCLESPQIPKDNSQAQWLREFYQKECMKKGLRENGVNDSDICYISDVDEIWNPDINFIPRDEGIYKLKQNVYSMFLNLRSNESWAGTYITKYSRVKKSTLNHLDNPQATETIFLENGGWHFTFQGGIEMIVNKIENYGHQEMNTIEIKNGIEGRYNSGVDLLDRSYQYKIDEEGLPRYILDNKHKLQKFLK